MVTTVLVVEDDPVIIDLLTLELAGWTVPRAEDAVGVRDVAGAVDRVTEPFDPADLAERVQKVRDATGTGG